MLPERQSQYFFTVENARWRALQERSGEIIAFNLTGGEASDATYFQTQLDIGPDMEPRAAIFDKCHSSKTNRAAARAASSKASATSRVSH